MLKKEIIFGIPLVQAGAKEIVAYSIEKMRNKECATIFNVNMHALHIAEKNTRFRKLLQEASFVHCDGWSVYFEVMISGKKLIRATPPDWIDILLKECEDNDFKIAVIGDQQKILDKSLVHILKKHPKLRIVYSYHGFFNDQSQVIRELRNKNPDLIMLAMGMPAQEFFACSAEQELSKGVIISTGALLQYYSGSMKRSTFLSSIGMEWITKLIQKPSRYAGRYLSEICFFISKLVYVHMLKKVLDVIISIMLIAALSPLLTLLMITNGIFSHKRIGKDGKPFTLYKIKTLPKIDPYLQKKEIQKINISSWNTFLRRTCIDELPQLVNICLGNMSLVGPRPEMPAIVDGYNEKEKIRLSVKPGLTGAWQVARLKGIVPERDIHKDIEYDLEYCTQISCTKDAAILLNTIGLWFRICIVQILKIIRS